MITIYFVQGYSSWNNKELKRAFKTIDEANAFSVGITDPKFMGLELNQYLKPVIKF